MTDYDFGLNAARSRLLSDLKKQDEPGPMRPRIYQFLENHDGSIPSGLKLQWMYYAGMGDVGFHDLNSPKQEEAARKLMDEGLLVPTFQESHYGAKIMQLTHFDDVNWGKNADGELVIYNLADSNSDPAWLDEVITPDKHHDAAIAYLKKRTEYGKTMEDAPISLRDGTQLTPILTSHDLIEFRIRQQQAPKL